MRLAKAFLIPLAAVAVGAAILGGCDSGDAAVQNLQEARAGHETKLIKTVSSAEPAATPPDGVLKLIKYKSPAGVLPAYISPDPGDGEKRPAIIWIFGGFSNGIDSTAWEEQAAENDQSAAAYRNAGIVMMYPALRGGHDQVGRNETFYGEVDDILAAADYLAVQPHVDPERIYLGGHSTGGTAALLVAAATDRFRAVFSFGPVSVMSYYGADSLTYDPADKQEDRLRSPLYHLQAIRSPTFVIEGTDDGNIEDLKEMRGSNPPQNMRFVSVNGGTHFSVLAPVNRLLAEKILSDNGDEAAISLTAAEAEDALRKMGL